MKILNLYSGIGGNRKLWGDEFSVTAIEIDPVIANIYNNFFPKDTVIITDAHEYLLNHYMDYDFIWSSPPCQSHSSFRINLGVKVRGLKALYPEMSLYQEILLLENYFKEKWVVENVKPFYEPLIMPNVILQRHCFWCNFYIRNKIFSSDRLRSAQIPDLSKLYGYDLSKYRLQNKRQVLRNCTSPEIGKYIMDQMLCSLSD